MAVSNDFTFWQIGDEFVMNGWTFILRFILKIFFCFCTNQCLNSYKITNSKNCIRIRSHWYLIKSWDMPPPPNYNNYLLLVKIIVKQDVYVSSALFGFYQVIADFVADLILMLGLQHQQHKRLVFSFQKLENTQFFYTQIHGIVYYWFYLILIK